MARKWPVYPVSATIAVGTMLVMVEAEGPSDGRAVEFERNTIGHFNSEALSFGTGCSAMVLGSPRLQVERGFVVPTGVGGLLGAATAAAARVRV